MTDNTLRPASFADRLVARLDTLQSRIAGLTGWRRSVLAFGCGATSVTAMAPTHASPVLLLTLPALLWLITGPETANTGLRSRIIRGAVAGWWFGFGYHLFGLYWIGFAFLVQADVFAWLLPFAVTLMPAGLALFWAGAGAAIAISPTRISAPVATFAVAVSVAEWLRASILTGFPWNTLGYALAWPLPVAQIASVCGLFGMTAIVVLMAAAPLRLLLMPGAATVQRLKFASAAVLIPIALLWAFGSWRLNHLPPPDVAGVKLRIVQPSIAQDEKWRPDKQLQIFKRHLQLSQAAPDGTVDKLEGVTHLIWAEAAMPFRPLDTPIAIEALAELLPDGVQLVAGILRAEPQTSGSVRRKVYNSAAVFDDAASATAIYDKVHLVPFGEYLPFQATLESLGLEQLTRQRGGFATGIWPRPLMRIDGLPPLEMLICYEAIFPREVGVTSPGRPELLLNLTNDGWFGETSGPYQHLHQTQLRAIEQGLPLIRVSNNGISAVFDAYGRERTRLPLNVEGVIDSAVPRPLPPTLYAQVGELIFLALLAAMTLACGVATLRRHGP